MNPRGRGERTIDGEVTCTGEGSSVCSGKEDSHQMQREDGGKDLTGKLHPDKGSHKH